MGKFSVKENMLNGISKNVAKAATIEAKENFKIEYIDIESIRTNKKNFYEISDIENLVEDISINGLNHNLVVRPIEDGIYELISGERRYTALKELVDRGENKFKKVPCKVSDLDDLDSEIVLIQANAQSRELSEADKLKQVERLTELYKLKKSKGEKVGQVRKKISEDTGLSPAQVGRYSTISKGLIKELKEVLEQGNLSISNASEFAVLSEENQRMILDIIKNEVSISRNEASELKNKFKEVEKEKEDLIKKEDEYKKEIKKLQEENEKTVKDLDEEIEKVKIELSNHHDIDNEKKLNKLEEEKLILEKEKKELIDKINKNRNENIEKIANEKAKKIISKFETDKNKIEKENLKLKNQLDDIQKDEKKLAINQELKIRLKTVRKDMGKVTGLMANNTIIDENLIKEVENLKMELRFLNEQIDLYTNQKMIETGEDEE